MGKRISRIGFLILGSLFVMIGITRGEVFKLFIKAINICLECIGIG